MEFETQPYIVYVKTDDRDVITAVDSSAFIPDPSGWVEIDSGFSDKYHHAQGNYFEKPIMDERGIWRYRLEDGKPVLRTQEEMDADYKPAETDVFPIDVLGDHEYRLCLLELGIGDELYDVHTVS